MALNDRYRPRYHFTAPQNWINDPNGLVQWRGRYHLYYQHNPNAAYWGDMHWGHAVSTDLMQWEHLPFAIYPDQAYDQSGVYSGIAVPTADDVLFFYTGVNGPDELPCLATASDDLLLKPEKHANNPLFHRPADLDLLFFRDHAIVQHQGSWYQVVGTGIRDQGGNCVLYRSDDLLTWEYMHPLVQPDQLGKDDIGVTGWECPDFFPLGDVWVLIVSHWNQDPLRVWAYIGTFDGERFTPLHGQLIDHANAIYAPQSFTDASGRRIQFGWLRETRPVAAHTADGWAGAMTLPRELFITAQGRLGVRPVAEVLGHVAFRPVSIGEETGIWMDVDTGDIDATSCVLRMRGGFEMEVLRSPDGAEVTTLTCSSETGEIVLDTTNSSLDADVAQERAVWTIDPAADVLVFIDRSVIEVYADNQCAAVRVYPTRDDATGIRFRSTGELAVELGEVTGPSPSVHS